MENAQLNEYSNFLKLENGNSIIPSKRHLMCYTGSIFLRSSTKEKEVVVGVFEDMINGGGRRKKRDQKLQLIAHFLNDEHVIASILIFEEVFEVLTQQVIVIKCKIECQMLSPDIDYACFLVFKLSENVASCIVQ
ncbi:hypothetical protein OSB04_014011 [Centaurea solstitialis]|uniref:Uncharacterized protein n=1 Tax=Centaurea solstitialis TaxID=347529 RepID=A0AA38WG01_9ASTR|nr:hypothetical protein OSB04_014011 [Centaurea solstitialis]